MSINYVTISDDLRIKITKKEDKFHMELQFNFFPSLDPYWNEYEILESRSVYSEMQVYGTLQEWREEYAN